MSKRLLLPTILVAVALLALALILRPRDPASKAAAAAAAMPTPAASSDRTASSVPQHAAARMEPRPGRRVDPPAPAAVAPEPAPSTAPPILQEPTAAAVPGGHYPPELRADAERRLLAAVEANRKTMAARCWRGARVTVLMRAGWNADGTEMFERGYHVADQPALSECLRGVAFPIDAPAGQVAVQISFELP